MASCSSAVIDKPHIPMDSVDVKLEIISLGLARTESLSLTQAIRHLGFTPVYHSVETTFTSPQDAQKLLALIRKKFQQKQKLTKEDMDEVTHGWRALTSAPWWALWEELMEYYPDAKVILCEREYDAWMPSFMPIVRSFIYSWRSFFLRNFAQPILGRCEVAMMNDNMRGYFDAPTLAAIERNARAIHQQHHTRIRDQARRQGRQILEFRLGEHGWEELCEFLQVKVPSDVDFPKGNEREKLVSGIQRGSWLQLRQATAKLGGRIVVPGAVVGIALWMAKNMQRL